MGPVRIGGGTPYEKLLAFDKTGAGILLLALAVPGILGRRGWRPLLRRAAPILGLTPLLLSLIVVASGYAAWDVTATPAFLWWGILNLLTTCVSEEALFRGLLQTRLVGAAAQHGLPAYPAILLTALIFGLSHVAGGPELVLLATLAGVGYGYAYHATRRVEAAILCHFIVNAGHFLLFT
jgi:membrane protease YdiL (CAAX protease family)